MPGTPATTPRHGAPRYANTDASDFAGQVNAVTDRFEITAPVFISGTAGARPAAGIADRYHYATDTGELTRDTGTAWTAPLNPRARTLLTSLPVGYDGQEILLRPDPTQGAIIWAARYNANSASASKWEITGGSPLLATVDATETTASATYAALATAGPTIAAPWAGDYEVTISGNMSTSATPGAAALMSFDVGATAAVDNDSIALVTPAAVATTVHTTRTVRKNGVAALAAFTSKYRSSAGTASFARRSMRVIPVRVG